MADNETGPLLLLLAAAGLAGLVVREWLVKRAVARTLPVLSLLIIVPFFIVSLYGGQRPLHVPQIRNDLYNVRFGLIMLVPAAILTGYLAGTPQRIRPAMYVAGGLVLALAIGLGAEAIRHDNVITYTAARETLTSTTVVAQDPVVGYLKTRYTGGLVLMESFGSENIAFAIPADQLVYEGSYREWLPSLKNPAANHIEWIVARCGNTPSPDKVCLTLGRAQLSSYSLVYQTADHDYRVDRLRK